MKSFKDILLEEVLTEGVGPKNMYWGLKFDNAKDAKSFANRAIDAATGNWILFNPKTKEVDKDDSKNTAIGWDGTNTTTGKQLVKQAKEEYKAKKITK